MAKILIIEDELKIQQIIKAYLEKEGWETITAKDGPSGLKLASEVGPDLIILDLMLPGISGEELLSQLRQNSEIPVIIISAKIAEEDRIFGLNIGADDYIIKPFSPRELVARIYVQLRRAKPAANCPPKPSLNSAASFNQGLLIIDSQKHELIKNKHLVNLTPTEFKIINLLAKNPGQVFSRGQLVEQIQGYNYDGYDRTIDTHIKNLRQKIEPTPEEPTFIITVFGVGYKFGGERDL